MSRLSAAVIVVGMTWLALQGAAAAQACTCADNALESVLDRDGLIERHGLSDELIEQLEQLEELERLEQLQQLQQFHKANAPLEIGLRDYDDGDLPWCTNQNDAQCNKLPAGSIPASINLGSGSVATLPTPAALPDVESSAYTFDERAGLVPRDAARSKLERPPR